MKTQKKDKNMKTQKTVFEYLIEQEQNDRNFRFDRSSDNGLVISYLGYKHMALFEIRDHLQKVYKLDFDFEKGLEEYDQICGATFCYFKNVYTN